MKQLTLATFLAAAALVGCNTYDTPNHGKGVSLEPSHNFMGILKTEPGSYAPVNKASIDLTTNELFTHRATSGDRYTLFWGAITITDY